MVNLQTQASSINQAVDLILTENQQTLKSVDEDAIAQLIETLLNTQRIFVEGEGRSGLVIRMVAMRLMHLGLQVYVVGETTTPSIQAGDLLVTCSGSGSTDAVSAIALKAKEIAAIVAAITTQVESPLATTADIVIKIDAAAKQDHSQQRSQQFAGSLFEQSTLLLFDALFFVLSHQFNKSATALYALHTNLE